MNDISSDIEKRLKSGSPSIPIDAEIEDRLGLAKGAGQLDLGDERVSAGTRFSLSSANTFTEKMNTFKKTYPNGDLISMPVTNELLFRADPSRPYSRIDEPGFEPLKDTLEFIGEDAGAMIGEIAATVRTKGVNLLPYVFRLFGGSVVGELTQQAEQTITGTQEESLGDVSVRALTKGGMSAGFGAAGGAAFKLIDIAAGRGLTGLKPGAMEAMRSIEELKSRGIDIPQLTVGEATNSPLLQKIEGQSGSVMATIQDYMTLQNQNVVSAFNTLRDKEAAQQLLGGGLEQAFNRTKGEILDLAKAKAITHEAAGIKIKEGIAKFDQKSEFLVNEAYTRARAIEPPIFDISGLVGVAKDVGTRRFGLGTPEKAPSAILDARGRPAGEITQPAKELPVSSKIESEITDIVNTLSKLDPSLPPTRTPDGTIVTGVDQLRYLRTRLWELKTPPAGEIRRAPEKMAAKLYGEITNVLRNPVNKNDKFLKAWNKADKLAKERFKTMDELLVIEASKTSTPAKLAQQLAQPGEIDNLKLLRSILPIKEFDDFQNSFKLNLVEDADNITKRLGSFDKPTLDSLLSPEEQRIYKNIGNQVDQLNSTGVKTALQRQGNVGGLVKELLYRQDTSSIDKIYKLTRRDSALSKYIRAGLIDNISKDVITISDSPSGVMAVVDSKKLRATLKELEENGAYKFLTPDDKYLLKNLESITPFIKARADTGTSMQAGEAAGGWRGALTGNIKESAVRTVLEHMGIGNVFTSDLGRKFLVGKGMDEKFNKKYPALISAILGTALIDMGNVKDDTSKKIEKALTQ